MITCFQFHKRERGNASLDMLRWTRKKQRIILSKYLSQWNFCAKRMKESDLEWKREREEGREKEETKRERTRTRLVGAYRTTTTIKSISDMPMCVVLCGVGFLPHRTGNDENKPSITIDYVEFYFQSSFAVHLILMRLLTTELSCGIWTSFFCLLFNFGFVSFHFSPSLFFVYFVIFFSVASLLSMWIVSQRWYYASIIV